MAGTKRNENIDYLDQEILKRLSENGRLPFSELAKELKISNSLVHLRIRKLHESGIIDGFSVKLNAKEIGFETITYTGIATKEARYAYSISEQLKHIPEVVECHWVSGKYALFIKIVAANNEELRKILYEQIHNIEGVGGTDSFISFGSAFEKNIPMK
jgi:Lrp/AsnC family transcriptional regulator for asnA, asnC and gidA